MAQLRKFRAQQLRKDDVVVVSAGELIPGDGEVIEGAASVDESAMTGESAPVIRESGSDRSAVTGGTKVLSDQIKVRITSNPGETFVDRMISLVEGTNRQKTPNEIVLTILLSALTLIFFDRSDVDESLWDRLFAKSYHSCTGCSVGRSDSDDDGRTA